MQRLICTEALQRFAGLALPAPEAPRFFAPPMGARAELREDQSQHLELGGCHAGIVDQLIGAQRAQARLKLGAGDTLARRPALSISRHRFDVQIQGIQEQAARRTVRTAVRGVGPKQCMAWIDADDARAIACSDVERALEIGEIADTPVALAA